uniref:RecD helicase /ATP-dependent exoDNAse n=1 Tax=Pithovirus LCPAC304 TaxID=2506594 RepID=A0A481ZAS3_9VIRU|nr:MAG: RecD helicase /ATP-dependent exoDNAse [Pithovirus LCPAC304]
MKSSFELVGKVISVERRRYRRNRDAEKFAVLDARGGNKTPIACVCSFFCPIHKNDLIVATCVQQGKEAHITKPPFVRVGTDRESIVDYFCKNIRGLGPIRSGDLYDTIERVAGAGKVDQYLSELAESWMKNADDDILQTFSELINDSNLSYLLMQWYHKFDKRRLHLLGLTNTEIRECEKICGSYYKIYKTCLDNPFTLYPIPEAKCMEILNRLKRPPKHEDIECGKIVRKMYENMVVRGWTCTPVTFLAQEFKELRVVGPTLLKDYGVVKDYDCAYLGYPHKVEVFVSQHLSKLIHSDTINDTTTEFVHPDEYNPLSPIHSRMEAEFRDSATLSEDQKCAIQGALDHKISIITGMPGTGKCLDPETGVLMFNGFIKKIKDIIVGDQVMGPDSTPRNVLSICSGMDTMYKIVPNKGKSFICNEPHVLTLKGAKNIICICKTRKAKYCVTRSKCGIRMHKYFNTKEEAEEYLHTLPEDIFDLPLNEYIQRKPYHQDRCYLYHTGVAFEAQNVPIDPYLLGCWLGDGHTNSAGITTGDEEIFQCLSGIIDTYGLRFSPCKSYPITHFMVGKGENYGRKGRNFFINTMRTLNLFGNKHIPEIYKINSREIRLKVLAGLLDTDGYLDPRNKNIYEITQKSKLLADDIEYLAFSLGFMVTKKAVIKYCIYKGEKREGIYHRLIIFGDRIEEIPTIVERKQAKPRTNGRRSTCLRFKVEKLGMGQYCGFELDGDGRFLLDDFLVTHNTASIKEIVYNLEQRNLEYAICAFTGKAVARLRSILCSTVPMTFHLKIKKQKSARFKVLIVDEASMVTTELLYTFIQCFDFPFNIVFVGDPDQLPPIGWGSLFSECIASKTIPKYELVVNHRVYDIEGEQDGILLNTKRMAKHGADETLKMGAKAPSMPMKFTPTGNFVLVPGNIDQISAFAHAFKHQGIRAHDITVITPYNKDVTIINGAFQKLYTCVNADTKEENECAFDSRGFKWYLHDRVMMTKNDYEINVMNGEEGEVMEVHSDKIKVAFGPGRSFDFPLEPTKRRYGTSKEKDDEYGGDEERTVKKLVHSYCVTVHRAQGSEWDYVIFYLPLGRSQPSYITKNLVYTGLTRAKRALFFIGNIPELEASTTRSLPFRCEKLTKRLGETLEVWEADQGALRDGEDDYHNHYEDDDDIYEPEWDGY